MCPSVCVQYICLNPQLKWAQPIKKKTKTTTQMTRCLRYFNLFINLSHLTCVCLPGKWLLVPSLKVTSQSWHKWNKKSKKQVNGTITDQSEAPWTQTGTRQLRRTPKELWEWTFISQWLWRNNRIYVPFKKTPTHTILKIRMVWIG